MILNTTLKGVIFEYRIGAGGGLRRTGRSGLQSGGTAGEQTPKQGMPGYSGIGQCGWQVCKGG